MSVSFFLQAQGSATDAAQLQSLLLAQQLQQQQQQQSAASVQNQLMQALQIQQLLQSAQQDLSGETLRLIFAIPTQSSP